jgi:class 3 adenylate cyclase
MFIDVVDSTRLTEVMGDDEWSRIRSRCRALLRACYSAHRGTEVSAQGDGFLARFGSPADAVCCGIEIQRRLLDQREDAGFAPAVRIGVHAGEAVEEAGDLLGTVINMAARVMSEAQPAEVLITEAVADHLDGRFELEDRGLRTLKGLSRPRHLVSVSWTD